MSSDPHPLPRLNARHSHDAEAYGRLRETWLNERRAQYVLAWLSALPAGARVLEIGSGTGNLLLDVAARRPDLQLIGVEPLPNYVELSRRSAVGDLFEYGQRRPACHGGRVPPHAARHRPH